MKESISVKEIEEMCLEYNRKAHHPLAFTMTDYLKDMETEKLTKLLFCVGFRYGRQYPCCDIPYKEIRGLSCIREEIARRVKANDK